VLLTLCYVVVCRVWDTFLLFTWSFTTCELLGAFSADLMPTEDPSKCPGPGFGA